MKDIERRALSALSLGWAPTVEDVWAPPAAHVDGVNDAAAGAIMHAFGDIEGDATVHPQSIAVVGPKGTGKTHLLGWVRERVQHQGGYFFVVNLLNGKDFWPNLTHALWTGLRRPSPHGRDQLTVALAALAGRAEVGAAVRAEVIGDRPLTRKSLDAFLAALLRLDRRLAQDCQHTARALVLLAANDLALPDIAEAYLTGQAASVSRELRRWGGRDTGKVPQEVVGEVSRLLAVSGPVLLAVDQIDTLVAQSRTSTDLLAGPPAEQRLAPLAERVGGGLMDLRETMHRTLTVVACLPATWRLITSHAVGTVSDRFRREQRLAPKPSEEVTHALVVARLRPVYQRVGFEPDPDTWPVLPEAFREDHGLTPRGILRCIDAHVKACLRDDVVVLLARLREVPDDEIPVPPEPSPGPDDFASLRQTFEELRDAADLSDARDPTREDVAMPRLLSRGLRAWIEEQVVERNRYALDPSPGPDPAFHARLHKVLDETTEDEIHWTFRAIAKPDARFVIRRIDRVRNAVGLDPSVPKRKAYVLRTGKWRSGAKTREAVEDFKRDGGVLLEVVDVDLATFDALDKMWADDDPAFSAWLRHDCPAGRTALFRKVFGDPEAGVATEQPRPSTPIGPKGGGPEGGAPRPSGSTVTPPERGERLPTSGPARRTGPHDGIPLGVSPETGRYVSASLESFRKHIAIFAGSGSGKTVLLRRIVEECALRGVSSIVLDPNNDLARLGEPWPEPPETWGTGDAEKAAEYLANTEVVVWTPRREAGRPLSLQPLPDFAAVLDDPDELALALDTAVAALAPRARMDGTTAKAERGRAVLREALAYLARRTGRFGLNAFIDLLTELPDDVTPLAKAQALAEDMAQTLTAAMINDPLFGGAGVPLDPGVLLTPTAGKRARVSVVSFVGLPGNEQRQSFVNQLQMALFAWIKLHPAADRPLGGLFVMDEAQTLAPSGGMTASTESTLALASQARKYGLGLVFATQAPRGIHNRIVGNAATQFFGFLNSPAQIAAAKEMAQAKASGVVDISRLSAGQFYAVGEGTPFQKILTSMCLTHHPRSALTAEEVLARARGGV